MEALVINRPRVPPNVKFEVDDCEETWTFPHKFGFIHVRYMAFSIQDWPKLVQQCYDNTAPGGWVEVQDFMLDYYSEDGSYREGQAIHTWATTLLQASRDFGRDPSPGPKLEQYFKDVGFENVVAKRYRFPLGPWARDKYFVSTLNQAINALLLGAKKADSFSENDWIMEPRPG